MKKRKKTKKEISEEARVRAEQLPGVRKLRELEDRAWDELEGEGPRREMGRTRKERRGTTPETSRTGREGRGGAGRTPPRWFTLMRGA